MAPRGHRWTAEQEEYYLEALKDGIRTGQRAENGWKPQVFHDIIVSMRERGVGNLTLAVLKNKREYWKRNWTVWNKILESSGMGFDSDSGMVVAP